MILTYFWCFCTLCSILSAIGIGYGSQIVSAFSDGASDAIQVCISIAGPMALWSGLGRLMEQLGFFEYLSKLLAPICHKIFPSTRTDSSLANAISGNLCANLLGLGNAATPLGIRAVRQMQNPHCPDIATHEMCRLVVMNTASIQLLPTTVAAVRSAAGCASPFDIVPCVWFASILSVAAGLGAAWIFGRLWHHA